MSKFFTLLLALLLAPASLGLASETMTNAPADAILEPPKEALPPASAEPKTLSAGRFSPLAKKSPFTLASATEETADFAKDLFLGAYFRADGKDFVIVANRTSPAHFTVGTEPSVAAGGFTLVRIERDPSGDPGKLRAQVRKGTETAMLKYETVAAPAPVPAAPTPIPGQLGQGQSPLATPPPPQLPVTAQGQGAPNKNNQLLLRGRRTPLPTPGFSR